MRRPEGRSAAIPLVGLLLLTTSLAACSPPWTSEGSVSVLATWTGDEEDAFRQVLDAFKRQTGIDYEYLGTRAPNETTRANVQQGTPHDIVILPSFGELAGYVRSGDLQALDDVLGPDQGQAYSEEVLLPLDGQIYGVPVKANLKSMVWFNPDHVPDPPPRTWEELVALTQAMAADGTAPWCMGLSDTPSSGWPGTDWIEDVLVHQSGTGAYQAWAAGALPWNSPEVELAWSTWGEIVATPGAVRGGAPAALLTEFQDAEQPMFSDPPGCVLAHQPSFMLDIYQSYEDAGGPQPGDDFDFFPFPEFSGSGTGPAVVASFDVAGMFNDTPQARELIRFLASEEGQAVWPAIEGTSAFSVNQDVSLDTYKGEVRRRIAEILTAPDTALCMDAADLMPTAMRNAFHRAVQEYLNNPDPDQLEALLTGLDQLKETVDPEEWLDVPCGG